MLKEILRRITRTGSDLLYWIAPVWHLTNLRREAVDQLEDLHYQVGLSQANINQVNERLAEIDYLLKDPDIDIDKGEYTFKEKEAQLYIGKRRCIASDGIGHFLKFSYSL